MNTELNVPATMPMSIINAKSKIEPSPNAKSAKIANSVVTDVIAVRERQELTALLHRS